MCNESFIILAAGRPHQGDTPSLLTEVNDQTLFDWNMSILAASGNRLPIQLVVGYAADKYKKLSNSATLYHNLKWQKSGSGYSLLSADLSSDKVIVSYADILYRPNLLSKIKDSHADITVVYDSHWKQRFIGRTSEDLSKSEKVMVDDNGMILRTGQNIPVEWAHGEFVGLIQFRGVALQKLRQLKDQANESFEKISLSDLVEWLRLQGLSTAAIDVYGDWAELNRPQDIAHFILGTKAETLDRLSSLVKKSVVLDQVAFTVNEWETDSALIIQQIQSRFKLQHLVVRSSAKSEDAFTHSNAGAYTSVLKVNPNTNLRPAIIEVIDSYIDRQSDDQVLVQPMVQDVRLSGVAFTRTLEQGAPFYIVNYDESGDTESITSGYSKQHKSLYLRKDADLSSIPTDYLVPIVEAIKEVERILNYDALDIEFAMDNLGQVYLLQARPIAAAESIDTVSINNEIIQLQTRASDFWDKLQTVTPNLKGNKALFGVMPDWNPAEIIGTNPGQLAVSLYEHLILDDIWAQQRAEYGYKDVRPQPLLRCFAGKPYIDIRASFNSFLPSGLSDELTEKLVNFYLHWLESHPHLHDKVEFDVVPTCYGPGFDKWDKRLRQFAEVSSEEVEQLKNGLLNITQRALSRTSNDLGLLTKLQKYHELVVSNDKLSDYEKIRLLLEYCKTYGTLPFAHLARSGFVAVTLLKEGVIEGWLSIDARDGFMETLETVSHELSKDAWLTAQNNDNWQKFVSDYGHLRPGTYDITSPAYWQDPDLFLQPLVSHAQEPKTVSKKLAIWEAEKHDFFSQLRDIGLQATDEEFEDFLINSIEGREKAKFIFTRTLSTILDLIENKGLEYKLNKKELSNLTLSELTLAFNSQLSVKDLTKQLKKSSKSNKRIRKLSHACKLPPLLSKREDFMAFILTDEEPNYIGTKRITAPAVHLNNINEQKVEVKGCIVVIPQADPGYDWLFGQNIAGLITMYGGANSHMAIRSAEFGLPAAIGVGEQLYNFYNSARTLELDPTGQTIRVIN